MKDLSLAALLFAAILGAGTFAQAPAAPQTPAPTHTPGTPASADVAYSAAGLYNLANSYARAGKPGLAVLNYQRAALLAPNDADIQANLQNIRASLHLPVEPRNGLETVAHLAAPPIVAWIGVLGMLIAGLSLLMIKRLAQRRAPWIAGFCLGLAAVGFTVGNAVFWGRKAHEAVVIAVTTPIRSTPVPMGEPLQQLAEAETVAVTEGHEDFVLVHTASGRSGWVARADIADVVPQTTLR
jgi:xanthosine utilization system XapX-like protein